jgi:hypothetical protein
VHLPIPAWGLSSLVFTSHRHRLFAMGQRAAEGALPAIRAALGQEPPENGHVGDEQATVQPEQ